MSDDAKKKPCDRPVKVFRRGAIAASIWRRQAASGYEYFDFSLSRSWKSQCNGDDGYSSNFFANNEQALIEIVLAASTWIAKNQLSTVPAASNDTPFGSSLVP
jgi:hypothetical protein